MFESEGEVAEEAVYWVHRDAERGSWSRPFAINTKGLRNRRGHHDLIRTGIDEREEFPPLRST
jgi:hypothetical protein